jgi:Domain of unknown function (DUF5655)
MAQWFCPHCGRRFGKPNQSHECEPGLTLDEYLSRQPAERRSTYRAVLKVLAKLGPLDVDPVEVGIMIKRSRTFCELRPKRDSVELSFKLSRPLADPKIHRTIRSSAHRQVYFVHLRSAKEVDAKVQGWLAEAYAASPE